MPQSKKPKTPAKSNGRSAVEVLVDPLADADDAEMVADLYINAAKGRRRLRHVAAANGHELDDLAPGAPQKRLDDGTEIYEDGKPVFPTYREQMAEFDVIMERLTVTYAKIWHIVDKIIEQRKKNLSEAMSA